jgi:thiol-disulfide isomerase/thioredoxin
MTSARAAVLVAGMAFLLPVFGQNPAQNPNQNPNQGAAPASNPAVANPAVANPAVANPAVANPAADPSDAERDELAASLREASTSPMDIIRAAEAHLRKYPNTTLRPDILPLLAKEAVEVKDIQRIALYGVPALAAAPNDVLLLDRTASALLTLGGRENAEKALDYGKRFEQFVEGLPVVEGSDPARNQEDHDRALSRALLYQARALGALGMNDEARKKAQLAYIAYADEPSAREWSEALERLGNHEEAIHRLADAFAIPDTRVSEEDRALDRKQLGEIYRKIHGGSEAGLGDEILAAYDRTSTAIEKRRAQLRTLDPNTGIADPMNFTLRPLDGDAKLHMASLKGKVLILDFWATWCVPCRAQHPLYDQVKKRFQDRSDVLFLSVDAAEDPDLVSHFLDEQKWSRSVYMDSGLVRLLSVNSIPTTIVIDKQGHVASRMNGFVPDGFVELLSKRVAALLADPLAKTP